MHKTRTLHIQWRYSYSVRWLYSLIFSYHQQIQFTYEFETYQRISFLDVSISKLTNRKVETAIFRNEANTIYT